MFMHKNTRIKNTCLQLVLPGSNFFPCPASNRRGSPCVFQVVVSLSIVSFLIIIGTLQSFTKYFETCIFIYKISKFLPSGARPSPPPPSPLPLQNNVDSYCKHCATQFQLDHKQHCFVGGRGEEIILSHG
jgi:hypothetical protein